MLHLIHILQFSTNSLWASWVKTTILKGYSIWQIPIPSDCSWIWKQVLKPLALQHLHYYLGRGDHFNLWFDPWIEGAAINPNHDLLSHSGLSERATVSAILRVSSWILPSSNHHEVITFRQLFDGIPIPSMNEDCIVWGDRNINYVKARHIWESIRHRGQQVDWHKVIWNNLHVPRFLYPLAWFSEKAPNQ